MEIQISGEIVRRVHGGQDAPVTEAAVMARKIANFLPLVCQRAGAVIVHNADARYTGIRFDVVAGWAVLEMPTGDGPYRIVHQAFQDDGFGLTEKEIRRIDRTHKPEGVALTTAHALLSRGFLK
ncbi:hypothetical protein [Streptomyces sp. N35]|uniref:hypothetical protein n=1 Tax=Streptomyces sp. N35 TaxID=2795730 RepID=UPI0018F3AC06|nr:hypothetical protein [Streptomyces sp. N35]